MMDWQIYLYQGRSIDFAELLLGLSERGMKNIKKADSRIVVCTSHHEFLEIWVITCYG